jgi:hypothetical protein
VLVAIMLASPLLLALRYRDPQRSPSARSTLGDLVRARPAASRSPGR